MAEPVMTDSEVAAGMGRLLGASDVYMKQRSRRAGLWFFWTLDGAVWNRQEIDPCVYLRIRELFMRNGISDIDFGEKCEGSRFLSDCLRKQADVFPRDFDPRAEDLALSMGRLEGFYVAANCLPEPYNQELARRIARKDRPDGVPGEFDALSVGSAEKLLDWYKDILKTLLSEPQIVINPNAVQATPEQFDEAIESLAKSPAALLAETKPTCPACGEETSHVPNGLHCRGKK